MFEPFDRFVQLERYKHLSLDVLAERRRESLAALAAMNLTPERLALRGAHPDFGPVTLSQLLATWTVHEQYRDAIGSWHRFVPIVDR